MGYREMYCLICDRCKTKIKAAPTFEEFKCSVYGGLHEIHYDPDKPPYTVCANCFDEWTERYGSALKTFLSEG